MPTPDLTALLDATGPFASVAMDVTTTDRANRDDLELRWRSAREGLLQAGAPEPTVDLVADRVLSGTGLGGPHTRWVVAADGLLVDKVLPGRPPRDEQAFGPAPLTLPVMRAWSGFVPYAVVRLDRAGADIEVVTDPELAPVEHSVEGGHDVLHKVPGGGWSQRRYQSSVEDSWQHNASAVAQELDSVWRRHQPEVFVVGGDEHAWSYLRDRVGAEVRGRLVRSDSVSRAEGVDRAAEAAAVEEVVGGRRAEQRQELVEEFEAQRATQQRATDGLAGVVEVLRRGQVQTLLLRDDPSSTRRLWATPGEPLSLATTREDAEDGAHEVRADVALAWAVAGSSAELVLVEDNPVSLTDGVGALLRWSDQTTPHDRAPAMPGHGEAPGQTDNRE